jgi:hypothetical protein
MGDSLHAALDVLQRTRKLHSLEEVFARDDDEQPPAAVAEGGEK